MPDAQLILHGDCLEKMKELADNSIDAVVTDPPYGLSFMGKKWDYDVPSVDVWHEVIRVLKPGGHILSFGGTRTYHRMVVAIEDAGFEIRDQIQWIYGSGFPKSHNLKDDWQGWGSALKPANEPIVLARKPLGEKTLAANVLRWGTGAINVDGSRIGMQPAQTYTAPDITGDAFNSDVSQRERKVISVPSQGRWPANVLFDESAAEMLGEPSRFFYVAKASKRERNAGLEGMPERECSSKQQNSSGRMENGIVTNERPSEPRYANHHPTVKPVKLMEYLCKLITPPNGTILDPFMGSGTTGIAAKNLGFNFTGIEMNEEYTEIAKRRIGCV